MSAVIVKKMFHLNLSKALHPVFTLQEIKRIQKPDKQHLKETQKTTVLVSLVNSCNGKKELF